MTTPVTHIVSAPLTDTTAPEANLTALRKSSVEVLYIVPETRVDGYDSNQDPINFRTVQCVYAVGSGGGQVRVEEFDTLAEANTYIRDDEGGFFS